MRLADNEMSGWTADTSAFPAGLCYIPDTLALMDLIDGYYVQYEPKVFQGGVEQMLHSQSAALYQGYVFDYYTEKNASQMYQTSKTAAGCVADSIKGFSKSIAFGTPVLGGGATIHAFKANLYFEMTLTGLDSTAFSYDSGAVFLNKFFSKIP
jgi:hypothetical protein